MSSLVMQTIAGAQTITTTTELGIVTLPSGVPGVPSIATGPGQVGVCVSGDVYVTPGTGTTACVLKLHQGTLIANPAVDQAITYPVTAGVATVLPFNFYDIQGVTANSGLPLQAGGTQYRLGITQTGATGNGTVNGGHIQAEV